MIEKLKQQKGETLIETMMSLMIAVMCMSILVISVTTSSKINMETNKRDQKYFEDLQVAEQHLEELREEEYGTKKAKVTITFAAQSNNDLQGDAGEATQQEEYILVTVYGGEDNSFATYTKKE